MPDGSAALYASRPTFEIDGQAVAALGGGLLQLEIVERAAGLYRCEARFGNWGAREGATGFLYFDRRTLDFGKRLVVKLGADTLFAGRITALEAHFPDAGPPEISALAEDRLQDLRMTRRTRTFADLSDADVASRIAQDHGLQTDIDLSGPTHRVLAQLNQSDLAFLQDRARAAGGEAWMEGDRLCMKSRAARRGTPLALIAGARLRSVSVLADLAHQRTAISASGWDVAGKDGVAHEATESAVSAELDGGDSGAAVLQQAFGARKDTLAHAAPATLEEARAVAEAVFRATARRFVTARGTAECDARLRVGAVVDLGGLGPLFTGKYDLVEVRHRFDARDGLRTEFVAERAGLGRP